MSKNDMTLVGLIMSAVFAFGGVLFAYGQEEPLLAVGISFVSLVTNYAVGHRAELYSY